MKTIASFPLKKLLSLYQMAQSRKVNHLRLLPST